MLLIQIQECALNWYTMEPVHEPKFDICHLRGLGAEPPKDVYLLIPICKLFPIDMKICMALKRNIS